MNRGDYILLYDQNGSPYIAHASLGDVRQRATSALKTAGGAAANAIGAAKEGVGRGVRTSHKYIQKIEENGKTRYFYTQEELKAYYDAAKHAAKNVANQTKDAARSGVGEVQAKANQARLRAERIGQEFQKKTSDTVQTAKNYGESVKNFREFAKATKKGDSRGRKEAYDKLMSTDEGRKLRETHLKVWDKLDDTVRKAASHLNGAKEYNEWRDAMDEYHKGGHSSEEAREKEEKAWEAYSKTAHYKFLNDNFVANAQYNGVKEAVSDSVNDAKNKVNEAASKVKKAAHDTKENLQDVAKETRGMLRDRLASANGIPGNSVKDNGEIGSMLGSYTSNPPADPKEFKKWADTGREKAQKIMEQAEKEYKQIEKNFKAGKYTQRELWMAQDIMNDLRNEMSEWELLSGMDENQLAQFLGPLMKKK